MFQYDEQYNFASGVRSRIIASMVGLASSTAPLGSKLASEFSSAKDHHHADADADDAADADRGDGRLMFMFQMRQRLPRKALRTKICGEKSKMIEQQPHIISSILLVSFFLCRWTCQVQ